MGKAEDLLTFAETLVRAKTGNDLSDLQQILLLTVLQGVKKSYEEIAENYNYSSRYLRQDVAPKLWQALSQALACKVSKSNVRGLLEQRMQHQEVEESPSLEEQTLPQAVEMPAFSPPSSSSKIDLEKGNILLVDDQPENLALLSHLLEEEGHSVQQAINGVLALRVIASTLPDLILLDIFMPELDGYSVCRKLRENLETKDIPVIFLSALDEAWDKVKAFSVGGNDFITKPFKTVEVLARVQNQLKVRRLQRDLEVLQQALQEKDGQLKAALQKIEALTS